MEEHFESFQLHIESKIKKQASSLEKLSLIIQETLKSYAENRVFAKILLLEVRSSPEYFNCSAYRMVRRYSSTILEIIQQGIKTGEIARDINPAQFRQVILGSIEHACLGDIIFEREIDSRAVSKNLCKILFRGVMP